MLKLYDEATDGFAYFWAAALGVSAIGAFTGWSSVAHAIERMPRTPTTAWIFLAIVCGIAFSRAISHGISAAAVVWLGACFFVTYIAGFAGAVASEGGQDPESRIDGSQQGSGEL